MNFTLFKEYIDQSNVNEASSFLVELYIHNTDEFKEKLLQNDILPKPIDTKISQEKLNTIFKSFILASKELRDKDQDFVDFTEKFHEVFLAIKTINRNVVSYLEELEKNLFSKYTFSEQLQMICIFIEDQNRLLTKQIENQEGFYTGMESQVAKYKVNDSEDVKISQLDYSEALIEGSETIIRYINNNAKNYDNEENFDHNEISPYELPSFEQIIFFANRRNLLNNIWEKFKFSKWKIKPIKSNGEIQNLFEPNSKENYLKERIAIERYNYREHISIQQTNIIQEHKNQEYMNDLVKIAKELSDPIQVFELDKASFDRSKKIIKNLINAQLHSLDELYFELVHKGLKVTDLLMGLEYLFTVSLIHRTTALHMFEEKEKRSNYKKLSPIIDKKTLITQFTYLYEINTKLAEMIIDAFTFLKTYKLDVFSQPLISINENKLIFCPSLITQMNIARTIEMLATNWNAQISDKGTNFEKELRSTLSLNPFVEVNNQKIEFVAYDGKKVEFDLIVKFKEQILLIECKHLKRPFSEQMKKNALQALDEGADQAHRREEVIINDWEKIKKLTDFNLPKFPPQKENIIKIICTNVFDFTSVSRNEVQVIDASSLLKFFISPEVKLYSNGEEVNEKPHTHLWEKEEPSIEEFKRFLNEPLAVGFYKDYYKEIYKPILKTHKDDNNIWFFDYNLVEDPFQDFKENPSSS